MATPSISGARTTLNILQDQREIDISGAIALLEPDAAPLTHITLNMPKATCISPVFNWLEDELNNRYDAINNGGGYSNSATSVVVDTGGIFRANDIVRNTRTSENFSVTSVSTNTLTIVRGVGSTAAAMNDNDELVVIASAKAEGADVDVPKTANPVKKTNYTQIFRTPWQATNTELASTMVHRPHDWDHQARKQSIEHKIGLEQAAIFGTPSEDSVNVRRTTGGFLNYVTTNTTNASGAFSEAELWGAVRQGYRYGTRKKTLFAAGLVVQVMNQFANDKVQTKIGEDTYGLAVTQYVSPFGVTNVVFHPLLQGAVYGGYALLADMSNIRYRYLSNEKLSRDTQVLTNRQGPGIDGRLDEILTECGFEVKEDKTHAIITGVTG